MCHCEGPSGPRVWERPPGSTRCNKTSLTSSHTLRGTGRRKHCVNVDNQNQALLKSCILNRKHFKFNLVWTHKCKETKDKITFVVDTKGENKKNDKGFTWSSSLPHRRIKRRKRWDVASLVVYSSVPRRRPANISKYSTTWDMFWVYQKMASWGRPHAYASPNCHVILSNCVLLHHTSQNLPAEKD